jgi:hypothetical protein
MCERDGKHKTKGNMENNTLNGEKTFTPEKSKKTVLRNDFRNGNQKKT